MPIVKTRRRRSTPELNVREGVTPSIKRRGTQKRRTRVRTIRGGSLGDEGYQMNHGNIAVASAPPMEEVIHVSPQYINPQQGVIHAQHISHTNNIDNYISGNNYPPTNRLTNTNENPRLERLLTRIVRENGNTLQCENICNSIRRHYGIHDHMVPDSLPRDIHQQIYQWERERQGGIEGPPMNNTPMNNTIRGPFNDRGRLRTINERQIPPPRDNAVKRFWNYLRR